MRLLAASFSLIVLLLAGAPDAAASAAADYFTDDELDIIRDAQGLKARLPAYFRLAEKRMVVLGVSEKSEKELEKDRKQQEQYEKDKQKAGDKAALVKPPVNEYDYLKAFTRAELLRGYMQVLDEVMTNLEDAWSRKLDVRIALEDFESFIAQTLPKIEKFKPANEAETLVFELAVEQAQQALAGAQEALTIVPRTEEKRK
jgi:hypothetical protein